MSIINFIFIDIVFSLLITLIYSFITKSYFFKYFVGFFIFDGLLLYLIINYVICGIDYPIYKIYVFSIVIFVYIVTYPFLVKIKRDNDKVEFVQTNFIMSFIVFGIIMYSLSFLYNQANIITPYLVKVIYYNDIQHNKNLYQQAIECINKDEYKKALEIAADLSEEPPFSNLKCYLEARNVYDEQNPQSIELAMDILQYSGFNNSYRSLNADEFFGFDKLPREISDFKIELIERKEYFEEQSKLEKFGNAPPYVGMKEEDLYYTSWGKPYKVEKDLWTGKNEQFWFQYVENGKRYTGYVLVTHKQYINGQKVTYSDGDGVVIVVN